MSPTPSLCIIFVRQRDLYVGSRCEKSVSTVRCVDTDPLVSVGQPYLPLFLRSVCHCQCYYCGAGVILF